WMPGLAAVSAILQVGLDLSLEILISGSGVSAIWRDYVPCRLPSRNPAVSRRASPWWRHFSQCQRSADYSAARAALTKPHNENDRYCVARGRIPCPGAVAN